MTIKYIAYTWPEYQEYMGEEWFREECYYCADKDIYFIPINRVNSTSAELKESNDKEIRKDIIRNLKRYIKYVKDGYDAPSAKNFVVKEIEKQIAWLEKQGKQETLCDKCRKEHPSHSCQDITELGRCSVEHGQKSDNSYCQENCKGFQETGKCFADGDCKAKREAKTIDNVKPKFKVGDWIVFTNGNVEHITSVGTHGYTFDDGDYLLHDDCDKNAHLWTINDAKDGDVLVNKYGAIFINASSSNGGGMLDCYCYLSVKNKFCIEKHKTGSWLYKDEIKPATKEQHDLLFQKMKEAGYEWDANKKELKKIIDKTQIKKNIQDNSFRRMF